MLKNIIKYGRLTKNGLKKWPWRWWQEYVLSPWIEVTTHWDRNWAKDGSLLSFFMRLKNTKFYITFLSNFAWFQVVWHLVCGYQLNENFDHLFKLWIKKRKGLKECLMIDYQSPIAARMCTKFYFFHSKISWNIVSNVCLSSFPFFFYFFVF